MPASAFISYSWDDDTHRQWVLALASRLRADGIDVVLDRWHAAPGDQLTAFMERAIRENDYVLIVCTPRYKQRSDDRQGGVGYEGDIMTAEVFTKANHRKFIPLHRGGQWHEAAPSWIQGKYYIDLTGNPYPEESYRDLLFTVLGQRQLPPAIGAPFSTTQSSSQQARQPGTPPDEDIRILGVAVDRVTMPRLDGTRGSALYKVPFQLSHHPSPDWSTLFVQNWNRPPRFTSMHRPGIARIEGSTMVLDGTTLDEVASYHRDTLKLVLEETNRQYRELNQERAAARQRRQDLEDQHRRDVERRAKDIKFD